MTKFFFTRLGLLNFQNRIKTEIDFLEYLGKEKAAAWNRDGDGPHDNPMYHQFKDDIEAQSLKIQKLQNVLVNSIIVDISNRNIENVAIGSIIKIEITTHNTSKTTKYFEIGGYEETDLKLNKISYESPIGKAIIGLRVGEDVEIDLPVGKTNIKIIELFPNWETTKK